MGTHAKTLLIIPTCNEGESLDHCLEAVFSAVPDIHVLIVDDASQDATRRLIAEAAIDWPGQVFSLLRPARMGLGKAYLDGFDWGFERGYEQLLQMDADLSHSPFDLPSMIKALEAGNDLAIGSRYIPGGGVKDWSKFRQMVSKAGNAYAGFFLKLPLHDMTGGYTAWKASFLKTILEPKMTSVGYCFQVELKCRACVKGGKVVEVPIIFHERHAGKSKMSMQIALEAMLRIPGLKRRFRS